jgi:meso-butanediol dehydrogenase / (S,S)-butanediol dehydrogenase / diacetyl reductase
LEADEGARRLHRGRHVTGDFAGKVALVTGAASGVGRATAEQLAGRGAAVACLDRRGDDVEALARDIAAAGGEALGIECELRDPASIEAALARALEWRPRLDALAHVAGLGLRRRVEDVSLEDWERVVEVNLRAPFLLTRAAIDPLILSGGAVVAVSSLAGLSGWPYSTVYSASKGGLVTMMRSLALELGPRGVRVNVVCPGGIDTPLLDDLDDISDADPTIAKRGRGLDGTLATPAEVAAAICFLASPAASHINGTTLTVDGGATA